jgi:ankyrin repeat protein
MLLKNNANIDLSNDDGLTALMKASIRGECKIAKLLIDSGAKIDLQSEIGFTALMWSCYLGHFEIAKMLIDKGAKVQIQSKDGRDCLWLAAFSGNLETCRMLVEVKKMSINSVGGLMKDTPIEVAWKWNRKVVATYLVLRKLRSWKYLSSGKK